MLNKLWGFMIIIGIIAATLTGRLSECSTSIIDSSKDAVSLCITMLGVMSLWTGIMKIADKSGLIPKLSSIMEPLLTFLFPSIPKGHIANRYIATNIISNMLGLSWAATPAGLKAMEQMKKLNNNSKTASVDMCTFLIINISSLQLIPVNIIAFRSEYGSVNPAYIVGLGLAATAVSTLVGVIFALAARKAAGKNPQETEV